jgi:hypothetical protein
VDRDFEGKEGGHDCEPPTIAADAAFSRSLLMDLVSAQRDMSRAYVAGSPGVFVSGVVWLVAGALRTAVSAEIAFAGLFVGGMLIVPAALLIARVVFGAPKVADDNPLQRLGFESTIVLFAGILLAYVLLTAAPPFAFPALALAIGARYFAFRTIYDDWLYWALGGTLMALATFALLGYGLSETALLFAVGAAECIFAGLLLTRRKRRSAST